MLEFLKATVRSLNRNGIAGAPFGILRKGGGDQLRRLLVRRHLLGNGGGQRQWDILGDIDGDQWPGWGGPCRTSAWTSARFSSEDERRAGRSCPGLLPSALKADSYRTARLVLPPSRRRSDRVSARAYLNR